MIGKFYAEDGSCCLWREQEAGKLQHNASKHQDSGDTCSISGNQQERGCRADDTDFFSSTSSRQFNFGKILEALQYLKHEHLKYALFYRESLQACLNESMQKEAIFLSACSELEEQILALISEEQPPSDK